jgi:hypothetical protein
MRAVNSEDQKNISVGRPVPFSIYTADKTLLLAAGRIVPNEFVRDGLLRSGKLRGSEEDGTAETVAAAPASPGRDAIAALQADYQHTHARASVGFRMEREARALTSRVIGVSEDGHGLIMSWPTALDGAPVDLQERETWMFRAFYAVAAVRFHAVIEKVVATPFPYFYVSHITDVDRRNVRQWPRTPTCLWASRASDPPRVITDISVGGARIGADDRTHLQEGQILLLSTTVQLAVGRKDLSIDATVLNRYGRADSNHPQVEFYGVRFENAGDPQKLILHAFVQEHLCIGLDRVWHVLTLPH